MFLKADVSQLSFCPFIRNPYASLVAIRKSKARRRFPDIKNYLLSLQNSYYYLYKNQALLNNYLVVKYEDLLTDNLTMMKKICDFLKIEFSEELTYPTLRGRAWHGNSSNGHTFKGISKKPLTNWQNEITNLEIQLVNDFLSSPVRDYAYERLNVSKSVYFPIQKESIKTYFKNRSLLWLKAEVQKAP